MSISRAAAVFLIALVAPSAGPAFAQTPPAKLVRLVVPFPAGGVGDVVARMLAGPMSKTLEQSVVVENRPGATAIVGTEYVARAPADGNMLLLCFNSFTINPAIRAKLAYDPVKDFAAVSRLATTPLVFAAPASSSIGSFAELLAQARAKPGTLTYGTPGTGGAQHLAIERFKQLAGIDIVHVPYQGAAPAVTALLGGHLATVVVNVPDVVPNVQAGKLRALAVTSATRSPALPDAPTVAEAGFAGYDAELWIGAVTQRAVPRDLVNRLNVAVVKALEQPEVKEGFDKLGLTPTPSTPEQFDALIRSELEKNLAVARQANLRAD